MAYDLKRKENPELVSKLNEKAHSAGKILHELPDSVVREVLSANQADRLERLLALAQDDQINTANIYSPLAELYKPLNRARRNLDSADIEKTQKKAMREAISLTFDIYDILNKYRN